MGRYSGSTATGTLHYRALGALAHALSTSGLPVNGPGSSGSGKSQKPRSTPNTAHPLKRNSPSRVFQGGHARSRVQRRGLVRGA
jgi:hypothetical protein